MITIIEIEKKGIIIGDSILEKINGIIEEKIIIIIIIGKEIKIILIIIKAIILIIIIKKIIIIRGDIIMKKGRCLKK